MGAVHAAVHDGHDHVAAPGGVLLPDRHDVDVGAGLETAHAAVVEVVPLEGEMGVVERQGRPDPARRELHGFYTGQRAQRLARLGAGRGRIITDPVPAVQPGGTVFRLEFAGIREHALQAPHAQAVQRRGRRLLPEGVGCLVREQQEGLSGQGVVRRGRLRVRYGEEFLPGAAREEQHQKKDESAEPLHYNPRKSISVRPSMVGK